LFLSGSSLPDAAKNSAVRGAKSVARLAERLSEIDGVTSVQIADANPHVGRPSGLSATVSFGP
jgi:hypothetical protein